MGDKTTILLLLAIIQFMSLSTTGYDSYKDARLTALYGENYYQYVYFVDDIRYNGEELIL